MRRFTLKQLFLSMTAIACGTAIIAAENRGVWFGSVSQGVLWIAAGAVIGAGSLSLLARRPALGIVYGVLLGATIARFAAEILAARPGWRISRPQ